MNEKISINNTKSEYSIKAVVNEYINCVERIGLWESEKIIFSRYINKNDKILDVGCGAGRTTIKLYQAGYQKIIGLDLSDEMIAAAKVIAKDKGLDMEFVVGNACELHYEGNSFDAVIFSFNGLMTVPTIEMRKKAMKEIYRILKPAGKFIFTTHYMDNQQFTAYWTDEKEKWKKGEQDKSLLEYGDLIFSKPDAYGGDVVNFVHVPVDGEIEECISQSGFQLIYNDKRSNICAESQIVEDFAVDVMFWVCKK